MSPERLRQLIGQRVRSLREEQGVSGSELGRMTGFSRGYISDFERGQKNVTLQTLNLFAEALGVDEMDFFAFPDRNVRHDIVDLTRQVTEDSLHDARTFLLRAREARKHAEERQRRVRFRAKG